METYLRLALHNSPSIDRYNNFLDLSYNKLDFQHLN